MKKSIVLFLFAMTLAGAAGQAEKEALAVLETWKQAMLHNDAVSMEKIFHKDLIYIHSSGQEMTKAEKLKAVADTNTKVESIDFSDTSVRVYGDTAIVKTTAVVNQASKGNRTSEKIVILHVLLKTRQGWQLIARDATKINK